MALRMLRRGHVATGAIAVLAIATVAAMIWTYVGPRRGRAQQPHLDDCRKPIMTRRCPTFSMTVLAVFVAGAAQAHEYRRGTLEIDHPWARSTPPVARNGAVYFEIRNAGSVSERLIAVSTPVAESADIHRTERDGDILRMRELVTVEIKPNDSVLFRPGGFHVMLNGLKAPLKAGTEIPLTLQFDKAGAIEIEVRIERSGPTHGPSAAPPHQH
jgi:periplasmic copper chaperone A